MVAPTSSNAGWRMGSLTDREDAPVSPGRSAKAVADRGAAGEVDPEESELDECPHEETELPENLSGQDSRAPSTAGASSSAHGEQDHQLASAAISVSSAVEVAMQPAGQLNGALVRLPSSPMGGLSMVTSALDAGLAAKDMVQNGIGAQNTSDLGAGLAGVASNLVAGPAGPVLAAFSAGYSVGKVLDRSLGLSDSIAGVSGGFMPGDIEATRGSGRLGAIMADALELDARVWDEGYQWYLQSTGEHAPVHGTDFSVGRAMMERAAPDLRFYSDEELMANVKELPPDLMLAVIRAAGERECGFAGRIPQVRADGANREVVSREQPEPPRYRTNLQP